MNINFPIFNGWFDEKSQEINLLYKKEGKKFILRTSSFEPYFYLKMEDYQKAANILREWEEKKEIKKYQFTKDMRYVKVVTAKFIYHKYSKVINALREHNIVTYEADLSPLKLLMLDDALKIEEQYDYLYFDIETDDEIGIIDMKQNRILSIAYYSEKFKKYGFISGLDEGKLIEDFFEVVREHDILISWNGMKFDVPYIKERQGQHGINFNWRLVHCVDLMYEFKDNFRKGISSYSLDAIGKKFVGAKKVERTSRIIDMFRNDMDALKEYNIHDVKLMKMIEDKFGLVPMKIGLCRRAGIFIQDGYRTQIIDFMILREARKEDTHFQSTFEVKEGHKVLGGRILEATPGFFENITVFDFVSLYPNIIRTFNISPETLYFKDDGSSTLPINKADAIGDETREDIPQVYFTTKKKGIVSMVCESGLNERDYWKKLGREEKDPEKKQVIKDKENIIKVVNNAVYGQLIYPDWRWYDSYLGNSVTGSGRWLNKRTASYLENKGFQVIGSHTDSFFVNKMKMEDIEPVLVELQDFYSKLLVLRGVKEHHIKLKFEETYEQFISIETSRYIAQKTKGDTKDKWKIVGVEMISAKSIDYLKRKQAELCQRIFDKQSVAEIRKFIETLKEETLNGLIGPEDLLISQGLKNPPEKYKVQGIHIKLAAEAIKAGKEIWVGQKIRYIITDFTAKDHRAVLVEDYIENYDRKYYWQTQIFTPLERILEVVFPAENWHGYYSVDKATQQRLN